MKYIEFRLLEQKPRTQVYKVVNISSGAMLGTIYWYSHWRQYIFEPFQNTVYSVGCLKDIEEFIDDLMKQRKARRR